MNRTVTTLLLLVLAGRAAGAEVQTDDLALGLAHAEEARTLELVRGGAKVATEAWSGDSYDQSVEFSSFAGRRHNPLGSLLAVNFSSGGSGDVNVFPTQPTGVAREIISAAQVKAFNANTADRLGALSVSPDNRHLAFTGYDSGNLYLADFAEDAQGGAATAGTSATLLRRRQVVNGDDRLGTSGTTWLDDDRVLFYGARDGVLYEYALSTDTVTPRLTTTGVPNRTSNFSDLEFEPALSPYLFALRSGFSGGATTNKLYVVDPASWAVLHTVDYSVSMNTAREIAFDSLGNLYVSQYTSAIDRIAAAAAKPLALADNLSEDYYTAATFASFTGIDAASNMPEPSTLVLLAVGGLVLLRRRASSP